jgi:hypothetical protein
VESGGSTHALINSHITYLICAACNSIRTLSQQTAERIIDSICAAFPNQKASQCAGLIIRRLSTFHQQDFLLIGEQIQLNLNSSQAEEMLEVRPSILQPEISNFKSIFIQILANRSWVETSGKFNERSQPISVTTLN